MTSLTAEIRSQVGQEIVRCSFEAHFKVIQKLNRGQCVCLSHRVDLQIAPHLFPQTEQTTQTDDAAARGWPGGAPCQRPRRPDGLFQIL